MPFNILSSLKTSYATSLSPAYINRHHTSWLLPPLPFALLRALLSLYILLVRIIVLALESTDAKAHDTSYFTNLTYWGLGFYFAFAALHSGSYAQSGRVRMENWPEWLRWGDSALYATVTVYPFVVTSTASSSSETRICYRSSHCALTDFSHSSLLVSPLLPVFIQRPFHFLVEYIATYSELPLRPAGNSAPEIRSPSLDPSGPGDRVRGCVSRTRLPEPCNAAFLGL